MSKWPIIVFLAFCFLFYLAYTPINNSLNHRESSELGRENQMHLMQVENITRDCYGNSIDYLKNKKLSSRSKISPEEVRVLGIQEAQLNGDPYEVLTESMIVLESSLVEMRRHSRHGLGPDTSDIDILERAYSQFLGARSGYFGRTKLMNQQEKLFRTVLINFYLTSSSRQ